MPQSDKDKLNRIERLKSKLFSKSYQTKIGHRDRFSHSKMEDISDVWTSKNKSRLDYAELSKKILMKTSVFKKFFVFSLAFFILTVVYASYIFFAGGNTVSNNNIDISVLGNNFTAGGEELPLIVGIANRNNSALDLVDLIVEYPKNPQASLEDPSANTERSRISLGTIPSGTIRNENVKVTLFGEQGSIIPIKISIEYRVEGSNAIFVKDRNYDVTISSTPINLSIEAPPTVSPNQDINLKVKLSLNATTPAAKILLRVNYPIGFQFGSSIPPPSLGNNAWALGDLPPGAERNISIIGKIVDVVDGEEKIFHISSGTQSSSDKSMIDMAFLS